MYTFYLIISVSSTSTGTFSPRIVPVLVNLNAIPLIIYKIILN